MIVDFALFLVVGLVPLYLSLVQFFKNCLVNVHLLYETKLFNIRIWFASFHAEFNGWKTILWPQEGQIGRAHV